MIFAIESWSPEYGAPLGEDALSDNSTPVDAFVETGAESWGPRAVPAGIEAFRDIAFVDGVRRVEANVWITGLDGVVHQGICASYAAGVVRCNGSAEIVACEVRRGLFCPTEGAAPVSTRHAYFALHVASSDDPDQLSLDLQTKMGDLERHVAATAQDCEVLVVDGPLKIGQNQPNEVGFVKTHHRSYGPAVVREVVSQLKCAERTPILLVGDRVHRFTWYLRLPCVIDHGWAGVVRIETSADQALADVVTLADQLSMTLPRFASGPTKDPRAPQNLYPIGGLERDLRRRLGDPALILRSLREQAALSARAAR